jgi:hypothetical protein
MSTESSILWEPVGGIETPCADLAFRLTPPDLLVVKMRFSNLVDGTENDLLLKFSGTIAIQWGSETFGIVPIPEPFPKCRSPHWDTWTFPLLRIGNSSWWAMHEARNPTLAEGRDHFAIVTMDDVLHVLAKPTVSATWIPAEP